MILRRDYIDLTGAICEIINAKCTSVLRAEAIAFYIHISRRTDNKLIMMIDICDERIMFHDYTSLKLTDPVYYNQFSDVGLIKILMRCYENSLTTLL